MGQVGCLNLLLVAWVASDVGRELAAVADQPLASFLSSVEHQPSLDASAAAAVAEFLAAVETKICSLNRFSFFKKVFPKGTENYLHKTFSH